MHPSLPTLTILCVVWKQTHHEMKLVPQGHTIMRAEFDSMSMRDKIEASHAAVLVLKWKQPVSIRPGAEGTAPQSDFNSHIKTDRVLLYYLHRLMQTPDFFCQSCVNTSIGSCFWYMLLREEQIKAAWYKSIVFTVTDRQGVKFQQISVIYFSYVPMSCVNVNSNETRDPGWDSKTPVISCTVNRGLFFKAYLDFLFIYLLYSKLINVLDTHLLCNLSVL